MNGEVGAFPTRGVADLLVIMASWSVKLLVTGWLLWMVIRAVRALESIAQSLREKRES